MALWPTFKTLMDSLLSQLGVKGFEQCQVEEEYEGWTTTQYAEAFGVSSQSICNWRKKVNWDWVKAERRKRYADKTCRVDNALYKSALKGDTQAAKLWYERFDGYTPTQGIKNLGAATDDELRAEAERIAAGFRRPLGDQPGNGQATA